MSDVPFSAAALEGFCAWKSTVSEYLSSSSKVKSKESSALLEVHFLNTEVNNARL